MEGQQAFVKFKNTIRQLGEPDSLYQPFQKVSHRKSRKNEFQETQRDSYRETHREPQKDKIRTVVPRQVEMSNYKIYQFILDSNERDKTTWPTPNHFVLKVATPFRNVFGIRILKTELIYHSLSIGPSMYVSLNNYKLIYRNETQDTKSAFARVYPGVTDFQCVTTNILDDPYTYILNPMEPKLQRFEITTFDHDNLPMSDTRYNIVLHLAIFCYS